jgi:hypothetical protein
MKAIAAVAKAATAMTAATTIAKERNDTCRGQKGEWPDSIASGCARPGSCYTMIMGFPGASARAMIVASEHL